MWSTIENFDAGVICESCALCSVHVNCCTFLHIRGGNAAPIMFLRIIGPTVQNLVAWATIRLRFVYPLQNLFNVVQF